MGGANKINVNNQRTLQSDKFSSRKDRIILIKDMKKADMQNEQIRFLSHFYLFFALYLKMRFIKYPPLI